MNQIMKALLITSCLALAIPAFLYADQNTPGPKPPHSGSSRGPGAGSSGSGRGWGEMNREEWEQYREKVMAFIKENSPNRFEAMEKGSGDRNQLRMSMFFKFRGLMMLKTEDPGLYDIKVKQIRVEDDEFALTEKLKEARKNENTAEIDSLKGSLAKVSAQYIALKIDERKQRIENLRKLTEAEQAALSYDQKNTEQLVNDRVEALMKGESPRPPRRGDSRPERSSPDPRPANAAP